MSQLNAVLNYAKSKAGVVEGTSAHRIIIDSYNAKMPRPAGYAVKYTDAWCDVFVTHVFDAVGLSDLIGRECSCGRHIEIMKQKGIWQENDNIVPPVGAIIMYDWDRKDGWPEHVGIVTGVSGNTITVLEGNYSNGVRYRKIAAGDSRIRGYGLPKYDGSSGTVTPSPTPAPAPTPIPTVHGWVADLQRECNEQGYSNQVVDNMAGPITLAGCPLLRRGAKGDITGLMQTRLISLGYGLPKYGADKDFGAETEMAVKAFQKARGLVADGIVGPKTWAALLGL